MQQALSIRNLESLPLEERRGDTGTRVVNCPGNGPPGEEKAKKIYTSNRGGGFRELLRRDQRWTNKKHSILEEKYQLRVEPIKGEEGSNLFEGLWKSCREGKNWKG